MSTSDLAFLLERASGRTVLVVGDVMLDHFVIGRVERISPEAPVPVVTFDHEEYRLGGAANVAHNLAAMGARVQMVGVIGTDDHADRLRAALSAAGIDREHLIEDAGRCTTRKLRIVTARNQQVARIDYERDTAIDGRTEARVIDAIRRASAEAAVVLVSDYQKGLVTPDVARAVPAISKAVAASRLWSIRRCRTSSTTRARRWSRRTITRRRPPPSCASVRRTTRVRPRAAFAIGCSAGAS